MFDRKAYIKKYLQKHREEGRARSRKHYHKHREEISFRKAQKRSKKKNLPFLLTYEQWVKIRSLPCIYCGSTEHITVDKDINKKGYTEDNVNPSCWGCNKLKLDKTKDEFIAHCKRIVKYQESKNPVMVAQQHAVPQYQNYVKQIITSEVCNGKN